MKARRMELASFWIVPHELYRLKLFTREWVTWSRIRILYRLKQWLIGLTSVHKLWICHRFPLDQPPFVERDSWIWSGGPSFSWRYENNWSLGKQVEHGSQKGLFDALQIGTLTCSVDVMRLLLWHRLLKRVVGGSEDNYGMDAYYTKQDITLGSSRSRNDEL